MSTYIGNYADSKAINVIKIVKTVPIRKQFSSKWG